MTLSLNKFAHPWYIANISLLKLLLLIYEQFSVLDKNVQQWLSLQKVNNKSDSSEWRIWTITDFSHNCGGFELRVWLNFLRQTALVTNPGQIRGACEGSGHTCATLVAQFFAPLARNRVHKLTVYNRGCHIFCIFFYLKSKNKSFSNSLSKNKLITSQQPISYKYHV